MKARVSGVAVIGSGVANWEDACAILRGERAWRPTPLDLPAPTLLAPNERRRASPFVRMALSAAEAACARAESDRESLDCVFASALGDGTVAHAVLAALTREGRPVSPTHFHNSVHNAIAGYWSIGVANQQGGASLAAGDGSFGGALLKALMTVALEGRPTLMVVLDQPFPGPLAEKRPISAPLAVALVLTPTTGADASPPLITMTGACEGPASAPKTAGLEALWSGVSAGRAIPLLEALEGLESGSGARSLVVEVGRDYFLAVKVGA